MCVWCVWVCVSCVCLVRVVEVLGVEVLCQNLAFKKLSGGGYRLRHTTNNTKTHRQGGRVIYLYKYKPRTHKHISTNNTQKPSPKIKKGIRKNGIDQLKKCYKPIKKWYKPIKKNYTHIGIDIYIKWLKCVYYWGLLYVLKLV